MLGRPRLELRICLGALKLSDYGDQDIYGDKNLGHTCFERKTRILGVLVFRARIPGAAWLCHSVGHPPITDLRIQRNWAIWEGLICHGHYSRPLVEFLQNHTTISYRAYRLSSAKLPCAVGTVSQKPTETASTRLVKARR